MTHQQWFVNLLVMLMIGGLAMIGSIVFLFSGLPDTAWALFLSAIGFEICVVPLHFVSRPEAPDV